MLGRPIIRFDVVGSTMDVLGDLAGVGAREGTVVVAEYQTAGRGRSGRQWTAPSGTALLHSLLLRPDLPLRRLTPLSLLVADALVTTLRELHGVQAEIKWPNDLLVGGRKISGVLTQTSSRAGQLAVIVGVGINTNTAPDDLRPGSTSLLAERSVRVDHDVLMWHFLGELECRYQELQSGHLERRWQSIRSSLAFVGDQVEIQDRDVVFEGILDGIDDEGALLLDQGGNLCRVVAGDVTRGPRPRKDADV